MNYLEYLKRLVKVLFEIVSVTSDIVSELPDTVKVTVVSVFVRFMSVLFPKKHLSGLMGGSHNGDDDGVGGVRASYSGQVAKQMFGLGRDSAFDETEAAMSAMINTMEERVKELEYEMSTLAGDDKVKVFEVRYHIGRLRYAINAIDFLWDGIARLKNEMPPSYNMGARTGANEGARNDS